MIRVFAISAWIGCLCLSASAFALVPSIERVQLRFLADFNFPTGTKFAPAAPGLKKEYEIGGLSAAYYDAKTRELYALSDDKENARIHVFSLSIDESSRPAQIQLEAKRVILLKQANGLPFADGILDPEGIAPASRGGFFISQEGNSRVTPRVPPSIFEVNAKGKWIRSVPVPPKYIPELTGEQTQGTRGNAAFEGLTWFPESSETRPLFSATEEALLQDDGEADFTHGSLARLFCLDPSSLFGSREFAYPISPLASSSATEKDLGRGISEILAIPRSFAPDFSLDPWVLVLERGTTVTPEKVFQNQVDLFLTQLKDASDISPLQSLKNEAFKPLQKTLMISLNSLVPQFSPGFQAVDNLEAMTWGPRLKNGDETLILISDNNFNPKQRTQLLIFAWHIR